METSTDRDALIALVRESVIGDGAAIPGPFGPRPLVYADYTASGRALTFIEDYIRDVVLPTYANTHSESSFGGRQTTLLREQARELVAEAVGATDEHAVIFAGSGCTGAVDRLLGILNLRIPHDLDRRYELSAHIPESDRPVVFIGPYEHHSNELPWRESIARVVAIQTDSDGHIDIAHLKAELERYRAAPLRIGSFSAASNVTGIRSDTRGISRVLHEHGALAFWDFAAAAPYVQIRMGEGGDPERYDAIFCSPHKLVGGPASPGLLVLRRELATNTVPAVVGGGTVLYVDHAAYDYLSQPEAREEGGTPDIIGTVRAGLAFKLKESVGSATIHELEHDIVRRVIAAWSGNPRIDILGSHDAERLGIVSFNIRCGSKILHHNFVVALLNDLFGIQSRGGCSCAGPYAMDLLHIDQPTSDAYRRVAHMGLMGIKPGWVRLTFPYFMPDSEVDYLIRAVEILAADGQRMLSDYDFEPSGGQWSHREKVALPHSLAELKWEAHRSTPAPKPVRDLDRHIAAAREILAAGATRAAGVHLERHWPAELESSRWFAMPGDAGC